MRSFLVLILVPLVVVVLAACEEERVEGQFTADCTDGADNDEDGLFDCADDSCSGSPDCASAGDDDDTGDDDAGDDDDTGDDDPGDDDDSGHQHDDDDMPHDDDDSAHDDDDSAHDDDDTGDDGPGDDDTGDDDTGDDDTGDAGDDDDTGDTGDDDDTGDAGDDDAGDDDDTGDDDTGDDDDGDATFPQQGPPDDAPVAIPASGSASSTLLVEDVVPAGGSDGDPTPLQSVSVTVSITHPNVGDLTLTLSHPGATDAFVLSDQNGGDGDNYTSTVFVQDCDDCDTIAQTSAAAPPYTDTFLPEDGFGSLGGFDLNATWTLTVVNAGSEAGTIDSWYIDGELTPPSP